MIHVTSHVSFNQNMARDTADAIVRTMDRMSGEAQRVAVFNAPKDMGLLVNSIHLIREYNPPSFTGGIRTNVPYGVVMEEGRKPGWPPFLPLFRWVVRNIGKFSGGGGGGKRETADSRARRLTFLIRRKIARKGIPSNPAFDKRGFFKKAEAAVRARFDAEIRLLGLEIQRAWDKT